MTSMQAVKDFLSLKRIAIAGVSHQPGDFSRTLFREFQARGYDMVPVNPTATEIEGQRCFARVQDISPPVDGVLLMTQPKATNSVIKDCADAGIRQVWMYRAAGTGAVSADAVKFCESHGIAVVPGECPLMFLPEAGWIHRAHGALRKLAKSYPV